MLDTRPIHFETNKQTSVCVKFDMTTTFSNRHFLMVFLDRLALDSRSLARLWMGSGDLARTRGEGRGRVRGRGVRGREREYDGVRYTRRKARGARGGKLCERRGGHRGGAREAMARGKWSGGAEGGRYGKRGSEERDGTRGCRGGDGERGERGRAMGSEGDRGEAMGTGRGGDGNSAAPRRSQPRTLACRHIQSATSAPPRRSQSRSPACHYHSATPAAPRRSQPCSPDALKRATFLVHGNAPAACFYARSDGVCLACLAKFSNRRLLVNHLQKDHRFAYSRSL